MARALIALGSNLDDRAAALDGAVSAIVALPQTRLHAKSSWIESTPMGGPARQPAYLNGALLAETSLDPLDLLARLQEIENASGRVRTLRWGPRTLDLDLLLYDERVLVVDRLTLPHPRLAFRRFVLEPAAQAAPAMLHPTTGMTIAELLERLDQTPPYLAIMGPPGSGKTRLAGEIANQAGCRLVIDPAGDALDQRSSAGPGVACEIEFLARRARLVSRATWPTGAVWTVSDFWFPQSLAWSEAGLLSDSASEVEGAYEQYRTEAMPARFLAALDVDVKTPPGGSRGDRQLGAAMRSLANRRGGPPVVWLSSGDLNAAVAELLAILAG